MGNVFLVNCIVNFNYAWSVLKAEVWKESQLKRILL